jgi:hypothetical protein
MLIFDHKSEMTTENKKQKTVLEVYSRLLTEQPRRRRGGKKRYTLMTIIYEKMHSGTVMDPFYPCSGVWK